LTGPYRGATNVEQSRKSSIGEILSLRSSWEDIVLEYTMDSDRKTGTIDNLKWFIDNGGKGNRFRPGFDQANVLARIIIEGV
jgi:hypothetical protein